mmetsp:Transcript_37145/g.61079  ORF Transcript_37145/g.61079 Transcript_37145/m.61079 type:complete len:215 (+) Transcript_37145:762-1406(+)
MVGDRLLVRRRLLHLKPQLQLERFTLVQPTLAGHIHVRLVVQRVGLHDVKTSCCIDRTWDILSGPFLPHASGQAVAFQLRRFATQWVTSGGRITANGLPAPIRVHNSAFVRGHLVAGNPRVARSSGHRTNSIIDSRAILPHHFQTRRVWDSKSEPKQRIASNALQRRDSGHIFRTVYTSQRGAISRQTRSLRRIHSHLLPDHRIFLNESFARIA